MKRRTLTRHKGNEERNRKGKAEESRAKRPTREEEAEDAAGPVFQASVKPVSQGLLNKYGF